MLSLFWEEGRWLSHTCDLKRWKIWIQNIQLYRIKLLYGLNHTRSYPSFIRSISVNITNSQCAGQYFTFGAPFFGGLGLQSVYAYPPSHMRVQNSTQNWSRNVLPSGRYIQICQQRAISLLEGKISLRWVFASFLTGKPLVIQVILRSCYWKMPPARVDFYQELNLPGAIITPAVNLVGPNSELVCWVFDDLSIVQKHTCMYLLS